LPLDFFEQNEFARHAIIEKLVNEALGEKETTH
jgi:hypothetical protein